MSREPIEEKAISGFIITTANWFHYDSRGFYIRTLKAFAIVGLVRARCRSARPPTSAPCSLIFSLIIVSNMSSGPHLVLSTNILLSFLSRGVQIYSVEPGSSRVDDEVKPAPAWPWRKFHPLCPPFLHVPSGNTW